MLNLRGVQEEDRAVGRQKGAYRLALGPPVHFLPTIPVMSSERAETGTGSRLDQVESATTPISSRETLGPGEPRCKTSVTLKKLELAQKHDQVPEIKVM